MCHDIEQWRKECESCVLAKRVVPTICTSSGHLLASKTLEVIAIDFTVIEKASDGHENILVVTDIFCKFPQAYPTANQ